MISRLKKMKNNNLIIWAYNEFVKKYQLYFFYYIFLKTVSGIMAFIPPIFIGRIIDYALNKNMEKVIMLLIIIMVVLMGNSVISIFESKLQVKINYLITNEIKEKVIKKFVDMELSDVEKIDRGEFISRLGDAEEIVQYFLEITSLIFIDLVAFIFALVVMFFISPFLSFICIINIPVILIVQNMFGKKIGMKEKLIKLKNDRYYSLVYEIIDSIKEIKIFSMQKEICKNFTERLNQYTKLVKDKADISMKAGFFSVLINGFFQLALIAFGCYFIVIGSISVGSYFTFNSYVSRFNNELQSISQFSIKKQTYCVSISRLYKLFSIHGETERKLIGENLKWENGSIRLENLFFRYQENPKVILNIGNFVFRENEISVIVGNNGAGKSTLFDLIANFYEFKGKIYFGNADINSFDIIQLRKEICYIQQKSYFFKRTILENLQLNNKDISIKEVKEACKSVEMHEVINELPDKYDTIVSEEGINFSGGQLQRLALARAILSKAPIILLDEITSGIDEHGRYVMYDVIKTLKKNHTILIISHDLDICKIADRRVYLTGGDIREGATAEEKL